MQKRSGKYRALGKDSKKMRRGKEWRSTRRNADVLGCLSQYFLLAKHSRLWYEHPSVGTDPSCLRRGCVAMQFFHRMEVPNNDKILWQ